MPVTWSYFPVISNTYSITSLFHFLPPVGWFFHSVRSRFVLVVSVLFLGLRFGPVLSVDVVCSVLLPLARCCFLVCFCSVPPVFPLFFAVSNLGDSQLSVSPVGTCFFSCLRPLDHRPCGSHDLTFVKSPFGSRLRSRAGVSNAPVAGEDP